MLNMPQNNLFVAPTKGTSELSTTDSVESIEAINGIDPRAGELFSNVISNALEQTPSLEQQQVISDLESLLAAAPELEAKIPQELLVNFLNSGGEDFEGLEQFIESETGSEIDLSQMLAANLNQAMEIYKNSGGDQQAINPNFAANSQIEVEIVNDTDGTKIQFTDKKAGASQSVANSSLDNQLKQDNNSSAENKQFHQQNNSGKNQSDLQKDAGAKAQSNLIEASNKLPEGSKFSLESIEKGILSGDKFAKQFEQQTSPKIQVATSADPLQSLNNNLGSFKPASIESPILVKPLQIETPVGKGEWSKQFNDQVVWLGSQQFKAAAIKLNPRDLGPVEVNIKIINDVASIQFNSHSVQVRELIEQSLPRLRDQLGEQGIHLSDVDVQDGAQQQAMKKQNDGDKSTNAGNNNFFNELNEDDTTNQSLVSEVVKKVKVGLVDYFA